MSRIISIIHGSIQFCLRKITHYERSGYIKNLKQIIYSPFVLSGPQGYIEGYERIIKYFFCSLFFLSLTGNNTIVLMPRGTARDKGKTIHQQFERGITARIASSVSQLCTVLVSHEPDTTLTWEQLVSNVNQLDFSKNNKPLVIVLSAHAAKELSVDVYRYTDFMHALPLLGQPVSSSANCFIKSFKGLVNVTVTFTFNLTASQNLAQQATNLLQKNKWHVQQESAPVRALEGLICPAILLDIGVPQQDIIDSIAPEIAQLCKELHA